MSHFSQSCIWIPQHWLKCASQTHVVFAEFLKNWCSMSRVSIEVLSTNGNLNLAWIVFIIWYRKRVEPPVVWNSALLEGTQPLLSPASCSDSAAGQKSIIWKFHFEHVPRCCLLMELLWTTHTHTPLQPTMTQWLLLCVWSAHWRLVEGHRSQVDDDLNFSKQSLSATDSKGNLLTS